MLLVFRSGCCEGMGMEVEELTTGYASALRMGRE
jgi:hypothetical protein